MVLDSESLAAHIGTRLDSFLAAYLERSRNHAQDLIRRGGIRIHPTRPNLNASYRLRAGDSLHIDPENLAPLEVAPHAPQPENIPLSIIHEDESILVLNKQPGLVVHPAAGHADGTLVNALLHHCGDRLAQRGGEERLGIVHRLDKDTSGLMIVAKTDVVHERLSADFAKRSVSKSYRALAWGQFRNRSGKCLGQIDRSPRDRKKMAVVKEGGRDSHTDYRVITQGGFGADVECDLHTGRTHQIRVHLSHLGHPVWGDLLYGKPHAVGGFNPPRQMLHAFRLIFIHPVSKKPMKLEAPLPADYLEAQKTLLGPT